MLRLAFIITESPSMPVSAEGPHHDHHPSLLLLLNFLANSLLWTHCSLSLSPSLSLSLHPSLSLSPSVSLSLSL